MNEKKIKIIFPPKVKFVASKYNYVRPPQFSSTSLDTSDAYFDAGRIALAGGCVTAFCVSIASIKRIKKKEKKNIVMIFFSLIHIEKNCCQNTKKLFIKKEWGLLLKNLTISFLCG